MGEASSRRAGYLLEFPLMACAAGILAGIISPLLPEPWNLVPWIVFVIALAAWFVYDRFCPGWRPRDE
jgi:biotin transporter BioY